MVEPVFVLVVDPLHRNAKGRIAKVKVLRSLAMVLLAVMLLAVAGCGAGGGTQAPQVDWTLTVEGEVDNPLTLSYADLASMEQVSLKEILMQKSTGEDTVDDWEGVPLTALFEQAGVHSGASGITAVAADGYAIMVSMADLEDGIVALKTNGEWIATADADHGPIRLVLPNKPANHWVFQLSSIVVEGAGALPPTAEWELAFEGAMDNERTFEYVQLTGLERVELEGLVVQTKSGESTHDFEGVPLTTLFDLVALRSDAQSITAVAVDGYEVTIDMADLGRDAMIALKMDGEWLAESDPESPIRLVVPGLPANKWVSSLVKIIASEEGVAPPEPAETPEPEEAEAPDVNWQLTIDGAVDTESTLEFADLASMDMVLVEDVLMQTKSGESTHSFEGVLLTSLFDLVGADSAADGITATASDGYAVTIPMADLSADAMVALKMDGEWLADSEPDSPIRIVVPGLAANQWVSQLVSITVEGGSAAAPAAPTAEWTLTVDGAVSSELTLDYAELTSMDTVVLEDVEKVTKRGTSTHSFEGILLSDLFDLTGVDSAAQTLTATASDGYSASIPLADLGSEAMVALKTDGEWLAEADPESPIELVVPGLPASQWISMLTSLTLE
jgi:DMSO/TMAO reductase YedYZ molybdopterin-dependent catalytic subunit